jgi:hypothetical protein
VKTTVEISDSLFATAKAAAEERGLSFRELIEEGLRTVLQETKSARKRFRLRDGSVKGHGLRENLSWPEIRQRMYEGRGE